MKIQALLFDKNKFTTSEAREWLKKHKHKPIKRVHITENYLRYRLRPPNKKYNYITQNFGKNIKAVMIV